MVRDGYCGKGDESFVRVKTLAMPVVRGCSRAEDMGVAGHRTPAGDLEALISCAAKELGVWLGR